MNDQFTIVFNHDYNVVRNNIVIRKLRNAYPVINGFLDDVTKEKVGRIHSEVFGYSADIDPENYFGRYVRKTNLQGDKSGQVFDVPQKREKGFVYQKLINNIVNGHRIEYRTYIINGEVVWIREKWKKEIIAPWLVQSRPALEAFRHDEIRKILDFCEAIRLDYGELDILRQNAGGEIFIVDVNDIPGVRKDEAKQPGYKDELKTLTTKFKGYVKSLKKQNT